jgi:hypothetical protein
MNIITDSIGVGSITYFDGSVQMSINQNLNYASFGVNWKPVATSRNWRGVAMSSSGQYQTATIYEGNIQRSTNFGVTWTPVAASRGWFDVAMSSSGQYQSAPSYSFFAGNIYRSTNFGITWTSVAFPELIYGVAMSSSGQYQTSYGISYLHMSSNYGLTWNRGSLNQPWSGIAISSCGKYQTSSTSGVKINISSDYGLTWKSVAISKNWSGVAISSSGQYQTAIINGGNIYISSDYGLIWTPVATSQNYRKVAISSSGQYQTATVEGGNIYISSDYGLIWTPVATSEAWYGLAMSSSGQYITASTLNGNIYTSFIGSIQNIPPSTQAIGPFSLLAYGTDNQIVSITGTALTNLGVGGGGGGTGSFTSLTIGINDIPSANNPGTTTLTNYGNLNLYRNRLIFSNSIADWNHCIYNNSYNNDNEGVFDGMKINSYDGFWVRTGPYTSPQTAIYANVSGNVGIGTTLPNHKLHLRGSGANISQYIQNTFTGGFSQLWLLSGSSTGGGIFLNGSARATDGGLNTMTLRNDSGDLRLSAGSNNSPYIYLQNSTENVGINTITPGYTLDINGTTRVTGNFWVNGSITCAGDITAFGTVSDIRLKKNIKSLDLSLDIIKSLHPVTFTWKEDIYNIEHRNKDDVGFIAQEVEAIIPFATGQFDINDDTFKKIKHERIIPYVVKSIQELSEKIDRLEEENKLLKIKLEKLM